MPARRSAVPTGRQEAKEGQSVDPLANMNPDVSPYSYCRNNPLRFIDPNGLDEREPETVYIGWLPPIEVTPDDPYSSYRPMPDATSYKHERLVAREQQNLFSYEDYFSMLSIAVGVKSEDWLNLAKNQRNSKIFAIQKALNSSKMFKTFDISVKLKLVRTFLKPQGVKFANNALGIAGGAFIIVDVINQGQINASHIMDGAMVAICIFLGPKGWMVGAAYLATDVSFKVYTGKDFGENFNGWVGGEGIFRIE